MSSCNYKTYSNSEQLNLKDSSMGVFMISVVIIKGLTLTMLQSKNFAKDAGLNRVNIGQIIHKAIRS